MTSMKAMLSLAVLGFAPLLAAEGQFATASAGMLVSKRVPLSSEQRRENTARPCYAGVDHALMDRRECQTHGHNGRRARAGACQGRRLGTRRGSALARARQLQAVPDHREQHGCAAADSANLLCGNRLDATVSEIRLVARTGGRRYA